MRLPCRRPRPADRFRLTSRALIAFMVSLSNHEGLARAAVRRFMVRQAHHEAIPPSGANRNGRRRDPAPGVAVVPLPACSSAPTRPGRSTSSSIAACARRSSRASWRAARGCRRRGRWRWKPASRATPSCWPTTSCAPRAMSRAMSATAPSSRGSCRTTCRGRRHARPIPPARRMRRRSASRPMPGGRRSSRRPRWCRRRVRSASTSATACRASPSSRATPGAGC